MKLIKVMSPKNCPLFKSDYRVSSRPHQQLKEIQKELEVWKNKDVPYESITLYQGVCLSSFTKEELIVILDKLTHDLINKE